MTGEGKSTEDGNTTLADLLPLKQQRTALKRSITNMNTKIEAGGNAMECTVLECHLQIVESYFKQLCILQGKIERLDAGDNGRTDFEDSYISTKAKILTLMNNKRPSEMFNSTFQPLPAATPNSNHLPSIKLPKFDGRYSDYKKFINTFRNMVHSNTALSGIEKFNYLLNCLSGQALAVVEPISVTENNYEVALARLKERYDNDVLIFLDHISQLFAMPAVDKPDSNSLQSLIDTASALRASLLSLGSEIDIMNSMFIHLMLSKVDAGTKLAYDEKQGMTELPKWDEFYKVIIRRCQLLTTSPTPADTKDKHDKDAKRQKSKSSSSVLVTSKANAACAYCSSTDHAISHCEALAGIPCEKRFVFVKANGLCINCLRKGHQVSKCQSKSRCRICQMAHHSILHKFTTAVQQSAEAVKNTFVNCTEPSTSASVAQTYVTNARKIALFPTAIILVKDQFGQFQPARALLDSCSDMNFITEERAKLLGLTFSRTFQEICGLAEARTNVKFCTTTTFKSRVSNFERNTCFAITKTISAPQPADIIDVGAWNMPKHIQLADPKFYEPGHIDILLNSEIFFDLLLNGKISLGEGKPHLISTALGWIVGGRISSVGNNSHGTCYISTISEPDLNSLLQRFWSIEEPHCAPVKYTDEEFFCEQFFVENVTTCEDGRVQVRLPFKHAPELLGDSYENARKRFLALERRLERDATLKRMYVNFMEEYAKLNHMSKVPSIAGTHFFIPHHCVLRPQSETTKLRVVFDASAKTTSGLSLNDTLMVGPTVQQDLVTTLVAFRLNKYALTADISKMYRQFRVDERDRRYQMILWRSNLDDPIEMYRLNTITYGTSAAPFLAVRSVLHIVELHGHRYPTGAKVLHDDMYVDDILTGAGSIEEIRSIKAETEELLSKCGLTLAKWNCNAQEFFDKGSEEFSIKTSDDYTTKALGMSWKPANDIFCFQYELPSFDTNTKRSILSTVAKLFDILGLLSPVTVRCKLIIQELWIRSIGWDEQLPKDLNLLWESIKSDLVLIANFNIPRFVFTSNEISCQIHGFADASQRAYGCCIYVRANIQGTIKVTLLIARGKVAPIKAQSIPKLELCAALLLCRVFRKIESKLPPVIGNITFWTDSKIVLQWLKLHSSTLNTFVANRVSEIQELQRVMWNHVPSKSNPADLVSRGCSANELEKTMWLCGPTFLYEDPSTWPKSDVNSFDKTSIPECRKAAVLVCSNTNNEKSVIDTIIERGSSYTRIVHTVAYILRIFNKKERFTSLRISTSEINNAFWKIIANVQSSYFKEEINCIKANRPIKVSLQRLTPFLQPITINGRVVSIVRVGGRLMHANLTYDERFPALFPKEHRFIELFVRFLHVTNLHAGCKVLIGILRQRLWVVNARNIVRKIVRNCVQCFHYKPRLINQIMGNLPQDRITAQLPFLVTGVDFCGPFGTSYGIRGKRPYKTYVAIFICFSTKAIHAELVSDLSTNSFLLCLQRFVGRRGIPHRIYCDNATNFAGANTRLKELQNIIFCKQSVDALWDYSSFTGFEFRFIPPRAPHFGGLWEAAVKSMKSLMVKKVSEAHLTFEELLTVVIEAEAILNSRPLAAHSNDPNDGEVITPAHLLNGRSLKAIPEKSVDCTNITNLARYQRVTFLKQRLWKSWLKDYVLGLQQRAKWLEPQPNIQINQMVLIHDDNTPPRQWPLARVLRTISGSDGKVRVVELKTSSGTFIRPIHKIAPLPLEDA